MKRPVQGIMLTVLTAAIGLAGAAHAITLNVSHAGSDSPTCGAVATPCRTISQAIANAAAGDVILVGPGVYGNLNGDADLSDPGEENSGTPGIGILINKQLTLTAASGSGSVVLSGSGLSLTALVSITGNGAVFGKKGKGFDLNDLGMGAAVSVGAATTGVVVSGNTFRDNDQDLILDGTANTVQFNTFQDDVSIAGTMHVFQSNQMWECSSALTIDGSGHTIAKNRLSGGASLDFAATSSTVTVKQNEITGSCGGPAVDIDGSGHLFSKNTITARPAPMFYSIGTASDITLTSNVTRDGFSGFYFTSGSNFTLVSNVAAGHSSHGFYIATAPTAIALERNLSIGNAIGFNIVSPTNPTLIRNSAVGNLSYGIYVNGGALLKENNIYGNDIAGNCGLNQAGGTLAVATNNFWGAASGPSAAEPADNVCGNTANIDATSPAAAEFTVKAPKPIPY